MNKNNDLDAFQQKLKKEIEFNKLLEEQRKNIDKETERKWQKYIESQKNIKYDYGPKLYMDAKEHEQSYNNCCIL